MTERSLALRGAAFCALTLGAGAVLAQSQVTFYGRLNTSLERTRIEGQPHVMQLANNNSRIGFAGTEDLGSGLAAIFQFETGFRSDTGEGFTGRDTFVGVKGRLGTVRMGFFASPVYYAVHERISMHNHDTGTSLDQLLWRPAFDPENFRLRNGVTYATPSFGGLVLQGHYAMLREGPAPANGTTPEIRRENHRALSADFDRGTLHLGLGYAETREFYSAGGKDSMLAAGVRYDAGVATLAGLYERSRSAGGRFGFDTGIPGSHRRNYWRLAAKLPVGSHEFHANYGRAGDWSGTSDSAGRQWTLAYNYNLSARTKVYAFYARIDNDSPQAGGSGGGRYNFFGPVAGLDSSSVALGLRHNF